MLEGKKKRTIEYPSARELQAAGYNFEDGKWWKDGQEWNGEAIEIEEELC